MDEALSEERDSSTGHKNLTSIVLVLAFRIHSHFVVNSRSFLGVTLERRLANVSLKPSRCLSGLWTRLPE